MNITQARTYYVCNNGNDNFFASNKKPWKTYDKAIEQFSKLLPGDSIAFCRGGEFYPSKVQALFNTKCTADNPCIIEDYIPEGLPKEKLEDLPKIKGKGLYFNTRNKEFPDRGRVVRNIHFEGEHDGTGVLVLNGVSNIVLDNIIVDNYSTGIHMQSTADTSTGNNITLTNSKIINNSHNGWLGGANNLIIKNNHFDNNGYDRPIFGHNLYLAGHEVKNILIDNNKLTNSTINEHGKCNGVSFVAHGTLYDLKITNNHLSEKDNASDPTCFGIGLGPGYDTEEYIKGLIIENNTLMHFGNVSIGCASCSDVKIKNNRIINNHNVYATAIMVPIGKDDFHKSDRIEILENKIFINKSSDNRYIKTGIEIKVENALVKRNQITLGSEEYKCLTGMNVNQMDENRCIFKNEF